MGSMRDRIPWWATMIAAWTLVAIVALVAGAVLAAVCILIGGALA